MTDMKVLADYIRAIEKKLAVGNATEQTYQSALEALLEAVAAGVTVTNEPRRVICGAPDLVATKGATLACLRHVRCPDRTHFP